MVLLDKLDTLTLLVAIGYLLAAFFSERISDSGDYRRGLGTFVFAVIFIRVLPEIYVIGGNIAIVSVPLGGILLLISLQLLCLSLRRPRPKVEAKNS